VRGVGRKTTDFEDGRSLAYAVLNVKVQRNRQTLNCSKVTRRFRHDSLYHYFSARYIASHCKHKSSVDSSPWKNTSKNFGYVSGPVFLLMAKSNQVLGVDMRPGHSQRLDRLYFLCLVLRCMSKAGC